MEKKINAEKEKRTPESFQEKKSGQIFLSNWAPAF